MVILFMFLLFAISFLYPAAVVILFRLNGDRRNIITIIRKEC